jgi:hypothetical protein
MSIGSTVTYQGLSYTVVGSACNMTNDKGAFGANTSLQYLTGSLTLPPTFKYVGRNMVRGQNNLTSINLNEGCTTLSPCSLMGSGIQTIVFPTTAIRLSGGVVSGYAYPGGMSPCTTMTFLADQMVSAFPPLPETMSLFQGDNYTHFNDNRGDSDGITARDAYKIYVQPNLVDAYRNDVG